MNIKFKFNEREYILTSDKLNFIVYPTGYRKDASYFEKLSGVLFYLYDKGIKDADNVTTFRELVAHSAEILVMVKEIQVQLNTIHAQLKSVDVHSAHLKAKLVLNIG